ncbi:hypothetical protein [Novosphingobium sp.]|uniref:hypothetical protein n=1 Tax=Novosphingobium sp. TaxID=1874826 RepID=UPI00286CD8B1|nr:hypothetical protein [Novosphingobium sp.]
MPCDLSSFENPQQLIDWAHEAIIEADFATQDFVNDKNIIILIKHNPEAGISAAVVRQINPIPDFITRKLTEALNNLRNSFDQSLFAACQAIGSPVRDAHFPWANNPIPDLDWKLKGSKPSKPKIPLEMWDVIRLQEPYPTGESYPGGNDVIRQAAKIANSKHTIGLSIGAAAERFETTLRGAIPNGLRIGPGWNPVDNDLELFTWPFGEPEPHLKGSLALYVRFSAPPPVGRMHAAEVLELFKHKAQSVLDALKARVVEIRGV